MTYGWQRSMRSRGLSIVCVVSLKDVLPTRLISALLLVEWGALLLANNKTGVLNGETTECPPPKLPAANHSHEHSPWGSNSWFVVSQNDVMHFRFNFLSYYRSIYIVCYITVGRADWQVYEQMYIDMYIDIDRYRYSLID